MESIPYLTELSWLAFMLIAGITLSLLSRKIKFPDILLLIILGIIIGHFKLVVFSTQFLAAFSIFALIMILFTSSSKFRPKEISLLSPYAIKLSLIFFVLCSLFLTTAMHLIFNISLTLNLILISLLFGTLMAGTSPSTVLTLLKEKKQKIAEILEFEAIFNTPLMVITPLMILDYLKGSLLKVHDIAIKFLQNIMTGVGSGLVIGLIIFRLMKHKYLEMISPLVIIAAALLTYTIAEYIGGSGILAVTMLGIVFGWSQLKEKKSLDKFSNTFTNFLKIIVFILLGLIIKIPYKNIGFLITSLILFGIFLLIRFLAVNITFANTKVNFRERIFMTLNISKGLAVAVVAFILFSFLKEIPDLNLIIDLSFLFIMYSIIISSISGIFSRYLLKEKESLDKFKKI